MRSPSALALAAFAAGSILFLSGLPAGAVMVTLQPDRDNSIFEDGVDRSCGDGPLFCGEAGPNGVRRALLGFDVAGSIPAGSTITSVQLEVTVLVSGPDSQATDAFTLHRVTTNWGEQLSSCGDGEGALAEDGDATWTHAQYPSVPWGQAGGDFAATASASTAMPFAGLATWTSTAGLVTDVQSWLNTPSSNFGWIMLGNELPSRSARQFASRESVSSPLPTLRVEYTAPTAGPPAVPDGAAGSPVRLSKLAPDGADLGITWDGGLCSGTFGHHIVYGTISGFPAGPAGPYTLQGSVCSLGTSPPASWIGSPDPAVLDPAKKLIWILVLADDATTEGSWGRNSASVERDGTGLNGSSSQCGILDKSVANTCGIGF